MQLTEPTHAESEERQRFQLERFILFTDAVFAIAITLLIIEIKVPHIEGVYADEKLAHALLHQIPEWIGFLVSFSIIGLFWNAHHRMFGYVRSYDKRLIFLNFLFLMSIVVMPFTSALYSSYISRDLPLFIYCFNTALTGLLQSLLWLHITSGRRELSYFVSKRQRQHDLWRGAVVPFVFLLAALLSYVNPWVARSSFALVFVFQWIISRYYKSN